MFAAIFGVTALAAVVQRCDVEVRVNDVRVPRIDAGEDRFVSSGWG